MSTAEEEQTARLDAWSDRHRRFDGTGRGGGPGVTIQFKARRDEEEVNTMNEDLPNKLTPFLSRTNRITWSKAIRRRFAGWATFDEYGQTFTWKVWTGRRPRTRAKIAFLMRRTQQGKIRVVFLDGVQANELNPTLKGTNR